MRWLSYSSRGLTGAVVGLATVGALLLAPMLIPKAHATTISIAPAVNGGRIWLDYTSPSPNTVNGTRVFNQAGMVFTAPSDVSILSAVSFYVFPQSDKSLGVNWFVPGATYFALQIFNWSSLSPTTGSPIGSAIYESSQISFSSLNNNPVDERGVHATVFYPEIPLTAGSPYLFQFIGNGTAGVDIAVATNFARIYGITTGDPTRPDPELMADRARLRICLSLGSGFRWV